LLKLYGGARSRASIVQWYLEELGLPYEFVMLDMQAGEHRQPAYLAINPVGKVPAIVDGDYVLWESGAILLYLAEKYGPGTTPETRGTLAQWVSFANATLGPGLLNESLREKEAPRLLGAVETVLAQHPYLAGQELTVADVAVGATLAYMQLFVGLTYGDYPAIADYLTRITDRPAYQKAIGIRYQA